MSDTPPTPHVLSHDRAQITDLVAAMVAIDSVNPDLVAGAAGEQAMADFVASWLRDAGLDVELVEADRGRPSVIATARGRGGGRSLMLNGHIDTVGVANMPRPHAPRVADGRLYGRGAFDMKGGVAACMLAAAAAARLELAGDLVVTAVADEEHASLGMQSVLERCRTDAAIVTEPTHGRVCVAHKGFSWFTVESIGRAAHGSRRDLGVDAIAHLGGFLSGLRELDEALARGGHPLLGGGSVHASLISGGQELSSYPERCTLQLERRTIPGESEQIVTDQLRALVDRVCQADPQADLRLTAGLVRDPFEISPDADIVRALREQAERIAGEPVQVVGDSVWMDAALSAAAGIPTVVFGPAGAGAHAVEEWVDLASVETCAHTLLQTAAAFCA